MLVFWRLRLLERATSAALTEAMGINRPSLYAAFGNKEALFRTALDHYALGHAGYDRAALALPTAREVATALLRGAAEVQTRPDMPHGCLAILGAPTCGEASSPIAAALIEARRAGESELRERFSRHARRAISRARRPRRARQLHQDGRLRNGRQSRHRRDTGRTRPRSRPRHARLAGLARRTPHGAVDQLTSSRGTFPNWHTGACPVEPEAARTLSAHGLTSRVCALAHP